MNAEERIVELEYQLFISIRDKVKECIPKLQEISHIISEIDVLSSFALISEKYHYIKPTISVDNELEIIESRHPVVEKVIKTELNSLN